MPCCRNAEVFPKYPANSPDCTLWYFASKHQEACFCTMWVTAVGDPPKPPGRGPGQAALGGPAWGGGWTRWPPEAPADLSEPAVLWSQSPSGQTTACRKNWQQGIQNNILLIYKTWSGWRRAVNSISTGATPLNNAHLQTLQLPSERRWLRLSSCTSFMYGIPSFRNWREKNG